MVSYDETGASSIIIVIRKLTFLFSCIMQPLFLSLKKAMLSLNMLKSNAMYKNERLMTADIKSLNKQEGVS